MADDREEMLDDVDEYPVAASVRPPASTPWSWRKAVLVYAATVVPGAVLSAVVVVIPMFAAFGLILVAVPYTAVVTYMLISRRLAAREVAAAAEVGSSAPSVDAAAVMFATAWQRLSLINAAALGVVGIGALLTMNSGTSATLIAMELLAVLSVVEIVVNIPWVYSRQTAIAEAHAIRARIASARIIVLNRWLSWGIWYAGCTLAIVIIVNYVVTMIAAESMSIY